MWLLTLTDVTTPEVTTPDEAKEASTILTVVGPCPPERSSTATRVCPDPASGSGENMK